MRSKRLEFGGSSLHPTVRDPYDMSHKPTPHQISLPVIWPKVPLKVSPVICEALLNLGEFFESGSREGGEIVAVATEPSLVVFGISILETNSPKTAEIELST